MTDDSSSPSYQRRQALRQAAATNSRVVQASRPLSDYLALAQRLREAFVRAVDERQVDAAYVYGLRLASLALESLPRHPGWKQSYSAKEKRRLASQVDQTLVQMEALKQRMDAEELLRQQQQRQEDEKRRKEEEQRQREQEEQRQRQEAAQRRLQEERQQILEAQRKERQEKAAAQDKQKKQEKEQAIQESAMAKLQALQTQMNKNNQTNKHGKVTATPPPGSPAASSTNTQQQNTQHASQVSKSAASTPAPISLDDNIGERGTKPSPVLERKLTPRSSKEQGTIDLLQRAIKTQETRMEQIESQQIPQLLKTAKEHLRRFRVENDGNEKTTKDEKSSNPHRRAAVQCLARKKKLERQVEVGKSAIFQMETQIFMLENAMEDRQVQKTLAEASQAMVGLQQEATGDTSVEAFADDLAASLATDNGIGTLDPQEEEELLEELDEWVLSPDGDGRKNKTDAVLTDEEAGMLALPPTLSTSLPSLPTGAPRGTEHESKSSATESVRNMLKAVLG